MQAARIRRSTPRGTSRCGHPALGWTGVLVGLLLAVPAHAQWRTLDRQRNGTAADAQFNFVIPQDDAATTVVRTDLYGQLGRGALGIYGSVPLTRTVDRDDPGLAFGNAEVGVLHSVPVRGPLGLTSHVGLIVPTASRSSRASLTNTAGSVARVGDTFTGTDPDLFTVRVAASPRLDVGRLFLRTDLGFDVAVPRDGRSEDLYLRANVGVGARLGPAVLTAEVANAGLLTGPGSASERYLHTGAVGARWQLAFVQPYAAFSTPLDDGLRGEVYVVSLGIGVGL